KLGSTKDTLARFTTAFGNFELRFDYRVEGEDDATLRVNFVGGSNETTVEAVTEPGWHQFMLRTEFDPAARLLKFSSEARAPSGQQVHLNTVKEAAQGNQNAIEFELAAGVVLLLRNVRLKPLGLQPIFNGKDLTGWKEHPNKKSQWSVN